MYKSLWTSFNSYILCVPYFHICTTLSKYRGDSAGSI